MVMIASHFDNSSKFEFISLRFVTNFLKKWLSFKNLQEK